MPQQCKNNSLSTGWFCIVYVAACLMTCIYYSVRKIIHCCAVQYALILYLHLNNSIASQKYKVMKKKFVFFSTTIMKTAVCSPPSWTSCWFNPIRLFWLMREVARRCRLPPSLSTSSCYPKPAVDLYHQEPAVDYWEQWRGDSSLLPSLPLHATIKNQLLIQQHQATYHLWLFRTEVFGWLIWKVLRRQLTLPLSLPLHDTRPKTASSLPLNKSTPL